ncbi:hypothetical protein [Micrococcoides hystricis]|uniref:SdpI family protein n=1 Tax=Micrococcoides hystricis TaxID=1572761 RepID=A0ABV6PAK3_9MICC
MLILFSVVLALIGFLFKVAQRGLTNGTLGPASRLGLRTATTTSSNAVWRQAHVAAEKEYSLIWKTAFSAAALLFFIGFFFFNHQDLLWPSLLFGAALVAVIVSYFRARAAADRKVAEFSS